MFAFCNTCLGTLNTPRFPVRPKHIAFYFAFAPLLVSPSYLTHASRVMALYRIYCLDHQLLHSLGCPFSECPCSFHCHPFYVGLAHSRYSGNGYSTVALMNTFVRTLEIIRTDQGEVNQLVLDERPCLTGSIWCGCEQAEYLRDDPCSFALIISSLCLAPGTLLEALTEYREHMVLFFWRNFNSNRNSRLVDIILRGLWSQVCNHCYEEEPKDCAFPSTTF